MYSSRQWSPGHTPGWTWNLQVVPCCTYYVSQGWILSTLFGPPIAQLMTQSLINMDDRWYFFSLFWLFAIDTLDVVCNCTRANLQIPLLAVIWVSGGAQSAAEKHKDCYRGWPPPQPGETLWWDQRVHQLFIGVEKHSLDVVITVAMSDGGGEYVTLGVTLIPQGPYQRYYDNEVQNNLLQESEAGNWLGKITKKIRRNAFFLMPSHNFKKF